MTLVQAGKVRIVESGHDGVLEDVATLRMSPGMDEAIAVHVALALTDLAGLANGENGGAPARVESKRVVTGRQTAVSGPRRALPAPGGNTMPLGLPPASQRPTTGRRLTEGPESYRLVRGVKIGRVATAILQVLRTYPAGLNGSEIFELLGLNPRSGSAAVLRKLGQDGLVIREGPPAGVNVRWYYAVDDGEPSPPAEPESPAEPEPAEPQQHEGGILNGT